MRGFAQNVIGGDVLDFNPKNLDPHFPGGFWHFSGRNSTQAEFAEGIFQGNLPETHRAQYDLTRVARSLSLSGSINAQRNEWNREARPDIAVIHYLLLDNAPYLLELDHAPDGCLDIWANAQGGIQPISSERRLQIFSQPAGALRAAPSLWILHKDTKPSNVLVRMRDDGKAQAQLMDFGIGFIGDRSKLNEAGITAPGFTHTVFAANESLLTTKGQTPSDSKPPVPGAGAVLTDLMPFSSCPAAVLRLKESKCLANTRTSQRPSPAFSSQLHGS